MSADSMGPEDELRLIVGALREHVNWHHSCGALGLPRAERPKSRVIASQSMGFSTRAAASKAQFEQASRTPQVDQAPAEMKPQSVQIPREVRVKKLMQVREQAKSCTRCPLHENRKNVVYGIGKTDVDVMIVGEGPGVDEDAQGVPFVGKAGQLLDKMLGAMGYDRNEVYIANVVKCRPPDNRTPERIEMDACIGFLHEQIELVQPKVIVAMGATAVRGLLGMGGITRIRGRWKLYRASFPVMPTFHPAYLLRNEAAKRDVWNDLKQVLKHLNREVPRRR